VQSNSRSATSIPATQDVQEAATCHAALRQHRCVRAMCPMVRLVLKSYSCSHNMTTAGDFLQLVPQASLAAASAASCCLLPHCHRLHTV
jgi:hypothetical protein